MVKQITNTGKERLVGTITNHSQEIDRKNKKMKTKTKTVGKTTKERYADLHTWGEGIEFFKTFSTEDLIKFRDALEVVDTNFGLTMRDDFSLGLIKSELDERARKQESK